MLMGTGLMQHELELLLRLRLVGYENKPCRKKLLKRQTQIEDRIKLNVKEIGCGDLNWIEMA
jgi:hypothetical protein